jgi:hypothetical protein
LDVEENQARRLLNDLDQFRIDRDIDETDEALSAHRWVTEAFESVLALVPKNMRGRLEPAEIYHEILQHRWYMSEKAGKDVGRHVAATDYVKTILVNKPEERAIIGSNDNQDDDTIAMGRVFPEGTPDISHDNEL